MSCLLLPGRAYRLGMRLSTSMAVAPTIVPAAVAPELRQWLVGVLPSDGCSSRTWWITYFRPGSWEIGVLEPAARRAAERRSEAHAGPQLGCPGRLAHPGVSRGALAGMVQAAKDRDGMHA